MDFFETVEKRASYRGAFEDREVPEEDIRKIVTAGLHAPSGYNFQTTSFIVVRNPELRARLAALLPTPATKTAPVIHLNMQAPFAILASGAYICKKGRIVYWRSDVFHIWESPNPWNAMRSQLRVL